MSSTQNHITQRHICFVFTIWTPPPLLINKESSYKGNICFNTDFNMPYLYSVVSENKCDEILTARNQEPNFGRHDAPTSYTYINLHHVISYDKQMNFFVC